MKIRPLRILNVFIAIFSIASYCYGQNKIIKNNLAKSDPERASAAVILEQPKNDPRLENMGYNGVPSIACSEDGKKIYVAYYVGRKSELPGNYVTLSISIDNGNTWKNNQLVVYPKDTTTRLFDPALWRDKFGQIWLFYATSLKNKVFDLRAGVSAIPISWNGKKVAFKKPALISYGIMINKPIYVPQKDFAIFPVSVWFNGKDHSNEKDYILSGTFLNMHSYKNGKTARNLSSYSSIPVLPDSMRNCDEHQVVQTSDNGGMLGMVRTKKGIYYSKSNDYGKSWGILSAFSATGSNTVSRFHISKLHSGNIILIMNDSKGRTNLTAFISKDGGNSWPYKFLIDNRANVAYPDLDQSSDGKLHITYDRNRTSDKEINYCSFTEDDIISGNSVNILRRRVNPF